MGSECTAWRLEHWVNMKMIYPLVIEKIIEELAIRELFTKF